MQESRVLRRPLLLVSTKIETGAPESKVRKKSAVSGTETVEQPNGKIQLLAISSKTPNITLIPSLPKRSSRSYNEFPVDQTRAVYPGLHLGASFSTYAELTDLVHRFQKAKGVHLYIRSSRKLYPALNNMGGTVRSYNLDLLFADIYYSCTKGGRRFHRSSSATSSANQEVRNCPFHIKLRLTRDGQKLYIRDIYPAHNHYLDLNSTPRIPNPSISENKPRPAQKQQPVLLPESNEICAVINKDFGDDEKRLVVLTKTPQRLLPMGISATGDGTEVPFQLDRASPHVNHGPLPDSTIELSLDGSNFSANSWNSPPRSDPRSSIDVEPECILSSEEKIVPDIDGDDRDERVAGSVSSQAELPFVDGKPYIKEEILDEFPCSVQPPEDEVGLPCADEAFVISRRQILELVKFCPRCGYRIAKRYYSDGSGSLGIALICSGGHTVELSLGKRS